ncbi:MAG: PAS domain-containing protein, partial [Promethearchaeota archaeon]
MEEEICLFLDKKELEILLTSVDLVKDLNYLSKKSALLNKLINKINLCLQSYIYEDLTSQKEFSEQKFFEPIYNELISLFNTAKEPITINIDENIKYANFAFCRMLGYESENEIIELGLFNLISKRYLPKIKNIYNKRSKGKIVPNIHDLELKRADGRIISIECVHYCMPFKKSYLIITFYIDLTKIQSLEKKLRESEEKYRILFENSPVGIGITNTKGNVFEVNKVMRELTGYTSEEMNGLGLASVYSDPNDLKRMLKTLQEYHKVRDYEAKLKRKDGTEYIALMNIDMIKLRG